MTDFVSIYLRYDDGSTDSMWVEVPEGFNPEDMRKEYMEKWRSNFGIRDGKWFEITDEMFVNTEHVVTIKFGLYQANKA